jgi:hypothetical protein
MIINGAFKYNNIILIIQTLELFGENWFLKNED